MHMRAKGPYIPEDCNILSVCLHVLSIASLTFISRHPYFVILSSLPSQVPVFSIPPQSTSNIDENLAFLKDCNEKSGRATYWFV